MPKPATVENANEKGEHLKDYVLMKNGVTGEVRSVVAKPEALTPLMINGWSQVMSENKESA